MISKTAQIADSITLESTDIQMLHIRKLRLREVTEVALGRRAEWGARIQTEDVWTTVCYMFFWYATKFDSNYNYWYTFEMSLRFLHPFPWSESQLPGSRDYTVSYLHPQQLLQ